MRHPRSRRALEVLGAARDELRLDRLQIEPIPSGRSRHWARVGVWFAIALCWAWGWGWSTVRAVEILLGDDVEVVAYDSTTLPTRLLLMVVFNVGPALTAALVILLVGSEPGRVRLNPGRPSWRTTARTVPVYSLLVLAAMGASAGLSSALGTPSLPRQPFDIDGVAAQLLRLVDTATAGPAEELALMALVVVGLRRCGYRWWVVLLVATLLRVPFHLYYGWGALGLSLWAIGAVLLYRRTGALLAVVVGHATWNVFAASGTPVAYLNGLLAAVGLVIVVSEIYGWFVPRRDVVAADDLSQRP